MIYKKVFAVDPISYVQRKKNNEKVPLYHLKNYDQYDPKLEEEFYLKYFLRVLLFEIDILEVIDFLNKQFELSNDPSNLSEIIKYKIIPGIDKIIRNSNFSPWDGTYYNQTPLEDGFALTEDKIKNSKYEFETFYSITMVRGLEEDLKERKSVIHEYLNPALIDKKKRLTWSGKPTHLAFLIGDLVENGYISPPLNKNGDPNFKQLASQILESFSFMPDVKIPTVDSLRKCANRSEVQGQNLKDSFEKNNYSLPHSNLF